MFPLMLMLAVEVKPARYAARWGTTARAGDLFDLIRGSLTTNQLGQLLINCGCNNAQELVDILASMKPGHHMSLSPGREVVTMSKARAALESGVMGIEPLFMVVCVAY
jgi:hypothetical protein